MNTRRLFPAVAATTLVIAAAAYALHSASQDTEELRVLGGHLTVERVGGGSSLPKPTFNADGSLNRPEGYRKWIYVGTPLTPNELNPPEATFPEFHSVYIHPDDFAHYERTGTFPDGTVLVKELITVGSKQATSGSGYFMGEFIGLEATIKDATHFKDEPGNWAYFTWGHKYPLAETSMPFPSNACNACHAASAADDFVFTQYYPVLRAAKGSRMQGAAPRGAAMAPGNKEFEKIAGAMSNAEPTAPTGSVDSDVPTDRERLLEYLHSGEYKQLAVAEAESHPGRGPHTEFGLPVRVFFDSNIAASLEAGNDVHPAGSAIVKEMFTDADELQGWAVMVKTEDESDGGKGWFWYEMASTEPGVEPVAMGNGVPMCLGCHSVGNDFVLTKFPGN